MTGRAASLISPHIKLADLLRELANCQRWNDNAQGSKTMNEDKLRTELNELRIELSAIRDELRTEFSKTRDAIIHIGAANNLGWLNFAITIHFVLLGIILWRLW